MGKNGFYFTSGKHFEYFSNMFNQAYEDAIHYESLE